MIHLYEIISFYDVMNAVPETAIPGSQYKADIIGLDKDDNKVLFFEIYVSHESENEKIEFLESNQLPYLELIPFHDENEEIQFSFHSYYLQQFFEQYKEKVDSTMIEHLYPMYKEELLKKAERYFDENEILKLKILAVLL
ncbi:hypothetical protein [Neobacillus terrae]|uniref:hypothetical protein n=1 Tax=Neobacillus terrae TaxID=3034837 RepID=UPI00140B0B65|nr:hypothetical protein [Neobacillus terrae]NHM33841.1 hypothetical protein [Neobacillus terrae]